MGTLLNKASVGGAIIGGVVALAGAYYRDRRVDLVDWGFIGVSAATGAVVGILVRNDPIVMPNVPSA